MSQKKYMSYNSQKQYDSKIKAYIGDQISEAVASAVPNDSFIKVISGKSDILKTSYGSITTMTDSAKAPIQGLKLFGKTTQNGTPTPEAPVPLVSAGDGRSLGVTVAGKNLLTNTTITQTKNGVAYTVNADGSVAVKGTSTATTWFAVGQFAMKANQKYILSGCPKSGSSHTYYLQVKANSTYFSAMPNEVECKMDSDIAAIAEIVVFANQTIDTVFYPMIRLASITDATYEPYKETQTLPISTPNSLPGIPVTSGGNYTDETGQQWICDEVDFGRGMYVQRMDKEILTGDEEWKGNWPEDPYFYLAFPEKVLGKDNLLCDAFIIGTTAVYPKVQCNLQNNNVLFMLGDKPPAGVTDITTWKKWLSSNPVTMVYPLAAPIETPLSAEELADYAALHTNYPNTTILNDGGAGMEVQYCTPLTSVPMVHGEADSGKILAIDEHGCVTKIEMDDFGSGSIDVDFDISNEAEANPVNADTLGGLLASDYAKQVDLNNLKNNLDNLDAGLQMELLWENVSPDSAFQAQKISLDLSGYKKIKIEWRLHYQGDQYIHGEYSVGIGFAVSHASSVTSYRNGISDDESITFGIAVKTPFTGSATETGTLLIPIKIYGIKGVPA